MRLRTVGGPMNAPTDNSKLVPLKWFVFIIKYLVITCGRMISAPTRLYKKKRQHNFCTVLVGADDGDCLMQKVLPRQLLAVRNPNSHQRS